MRLSLILICLFLLLAAPSLADAPPPLPHSFHGDVIGSGLGARIAVHNAQETPIAHTTPLYCQATLVYSVDASAAYDSVPGGTEGELLSFYVDSLWAATSYWHSGENSRLNLYPLGGDTATPTPTETAQLRLVIAAPIWRDAGHRGSIRVCAEYGVERICVTVWLEVPK